MPPINRAAWLTAKCTKPLQIHQAPYTPPGPDEIVVKNGAIAINPVDWIKQLIGDMLLAYLKYPFVPGSDVAGEVVEVGSGVQHFNVGDRVLGQALGTAPWSKKSSEGAFQEYTVLQQYVVSSIPAWVSYEDACVVPLCLATAAYGLFHKDFLALDFPTVPPPQSSPDDIKALIVTGGASSVGCNAIQLAASAGYSVYSTASPRNHAYLEKLGATRVFDYRSPHLLDDLLDALRGQTLAGVYHSAGGADQLDVCDKVLRRHRKTSNKFIALAGIPFPPDQISTTLGTVSLLSFVVWLLLKKTVLSYFTGVHVRWVDSKDLGETDGVAGRIHRDFLPKALDAGQFVPAPKPLIVGKGLEKVQEAMDVQLKGVSAQKVVVTL